MPVNDRKFYELLALYERGRLELSAWEESFVSGLADRYKTFGPCVPDTLSAKQLNVITNIMEKAK